jgi:hypothetical protein
MQITLSDIRAAIEARGLSYRGVFHPTVDDLSDAGTLVLAGFIGSFNWRHFKESAEASGGEPDALDRWSLRIIGALARELSATALFPFQGPPWLPFLRWAQKAEPLHPSPIGMLIHPDWGLWHSFRGALAFRERIDLPAADRRLSPCDTCVDKPCLTTCPVGAFKQNTYDVAACIAHIGTARGADCMNEGCRARRACPVGAAYRYTPDQANFHMRAFYNANR